MIFRVIVVVSEMAHPIDLRYKKHQDYAVVHLCNEGFYGSCHIVYVHLPIEIIDWEQQCPDLAFFHLADCCDLAQ